MPDTVTADDVLRALAPILPGDVPVAADTPLLSTGLVDSFAVVELQARLGDRFGVELDLADLAPDVADTAAHLAELIARRR